MKADPEFLAVVDTNIWISALLSRSGAPAKFVRVMLRTGRPVFNDATFGELESRLWRPKFDRYVSVDLRRSMLHDLASLALWTNVPSSIASRPYCRDSDDDKMVHASLASRAQWLVTGDLDLLSVPAMAGLRIATATEALRALGYGDADAS